MKYYTTTLSLHQPAAMLRQIALCAALMVFLSSGVFALDNVCDKFDPAVSSIFREGCRTVLSDIVTQHIYEDCKYFRDNKPARLTAFLKNINMVCNFKNHPVCRDIVFMIHAGVTVGANNFEKFKLFAKDLLDDMNINPSTTGTFVSLMKFSTSFTIETSLDSLTFEDSGGLTNTHLVIKKMHDILDTRRNMPGRKRCLQTGIMLLNYPPTNIEATVNELITVNNHRAHETTSPNKNYEGIRIIAVGVDNSLDHIARVMFQSQLETIATGFKCDNMKLVDTFSDLSSVANDVFKMIAAPRKRLHKTLCTQYAVVGTTADYRGVYEINGRTCPHDSGKNIQPIFEHVIDKSWIISSVDGRALQGLAGRQLWTVQEYRPDGIGNPCFVNAQIRALLPIPTLLRDKSTPDQFGATYQEFTASGSAVIDTMKVKCFSYQVLDYEPALCPK